MTNGKRRRVAAMRYRVESRDRVWK